MPTKQKTKPSSSKTDKLVELDALDLGPTETAASGVEITGESTSKKKRSTSSSAQKKKGPPPPSEQGIEVLGRKYSKVELIGKLLQSSGIQCIPKTVLMENAKRILQQDKFTNLLQDPEEPMKEIHGYKMGTRAFEMLREHVDYELTNLMYIANVLTVAKGKITIGEGEVLLARLIQKHQLSLHGNKEGTQKALIKCQTPKARDTIVLGQDVHIDKIATILEEAISSKHHDLSVGDLNSHRVDELRKAIKKAEQKLYNEDGTRKEPKKRKKEEVKEEEEEEKSATSEKKKEPKTKKTKPSAEEKKTETKPAEKKEEKSEKKEKSESQKKK
ncbi:hypothetical protein C9374_008253 [Naegleria lovaniensis]|uniref:Uncharacterized protein n=1 Tax=Naegleria lovaniensis TaxID=51637 RepID=A0AA88KL88_NAELO|nr:uncharacterized protein C9374_008253 [Naegleria lovaniensis]KAG2378614.1 hypothetical protein C9374_008253 [Naegleria lovaniensis]